MATTNLAFQNFFTTTLSSDITASSTTIPLNSLPNGSEGFLVIEPDSATNREVIYFTSKTGSAVVCPSAGAGRGQDDTNAASHTSGATVEMNVVAGMFEALKDGTGWSTGIVTNSHLSTSTGEPGAAWQTWTPTWTNITVGDGTVDAKYIKIGKTVFYKLKFTLGSTSAVGTNPTFTLPVTSISYDTTTRARIGELFLYDSGTFYAGSVGWLTTTTADLTVYTAGSTYVGFNALTASVPFSWASGDAFSALGFYEAA